MGLLRRKAKDMGSLKKEIASETGIPEEHVTQVVNSLLNHPVFLKEVAGRLPQDPTFYNHFKENLVEEMAKDEKLRERIVSVFSDFVGRRSFLAMVGGLATSYVVGTQLAGADTIVPSFKKGDYYTNHIEPYDVIVGKEEAGNKLRVRAYDTLGKRIGDGVAGVSTSYPGSDTEVLLKATDYIKELGGGVITIHRNNYYVEYIRIPSNCFVNGNESTIHIFKAKNYGGTEPIGTQPFQAYIRNIDTKNGNENIVIKNIIFKSEVDTGDARLSQFVNVNGLLIHKCSFYDGYVSNLEVKGINGLNYNIIIEKCKFINNKHAGVDNVHFDNVTGLTVRECEITGSPDIALDLAHLLEDIRLENLNIHDNASSAIFVESPDGTGYVNNFNIHGCTVKNGGPAMVFQHPGGCTNVRISNTHISECTLGLHLRGLMDGVSVSQVTSQYNKLSGVEIDTGVNNVSFSQCKFNGNGHVAYKFGAYLHGGTNIKFVNCWFIDDQENPTQQWGVYADNLPNGSCEIIACHFEGNTIGAIQPAKAFIRTVDITGDSTQEGFPIALGGGSAPIPIHGDNEYGTPVMVAYGVKWFDAVIDITAGAGEIITVKFECVFDTGTTYVEKSVDNSSGTAPLSNSFIIDVNDKLTLLQRANWLKAINCYAKSSLSTPSSSAAAKINIRFSR